MKLGKIILWRVVLFTLISVTSLDAARVASEADTPPAVGSPAPNFQMNSHEGTPVSLSDFSGKWVVLYFYLRDFARGCTIEAHNFQVDLSKYYAMNAVILGVSVDSEESHKDFCTQQGLEFKLLADTEREVSAKYGSLRKMQGGVVAARNTFVINPQGIIAKVFVAVDPNKHSKEVLEALEELQRQN